MSPPRRVGLAVLLGLALAASGCGSSGSATTDTHGGSHQTKTARHRTTPVGPERLAYRTLFALPAPLRDPATAPVGSGRVALLGGLNAADVSTDEIDVVGQHGVTYSGTLPEAQHDAQAATLEGQVYVFGGGGASELDHIVGFDPAGHAVRQVGVLPRASSDVAVAQIGNTAYVVGGFDGVTYLNTILAWRPGTHVRVAGHLPAGLRYSAVTAADGSLVIVGGSTPSGASRSVYSFDPGSGRVRKIARLPQPITHGGAAAIGRYVYLVGGRGDSIDSQTDRVWSIDPRTGTVRPAGRLPHPLSDAGVLRFGPSILVAGGFTGQSTVAGVGELVPRP